MRFSPDTQCFVNRLWFSLTFTAHMSPVYTAILPRHFRKFDQLFRLRVMSRGIDQRSGNAERAFLHSLRNHPLHLFQLASRWRAINVAKYRFANLAGPNIRTDIERGAYLLQSLEISIERCPIQLQFVMVECG